MNDQVCLKGSCLVYVCLYVFVFLRSRTAENSLLLCVGGERALSTKTAALRDKGGRGCRGGVPFSATETNMSAL